jgi:hypothetical protein
MWKSFEQFKAYLKGPEHAQAEAKFLDALSGKEEIVALPTNAEVAQYGGTVHDSEGKIGTLKDWTIGPSDVPDVPDGWKVGIKQAAKDLADKIDGDLYQSLKGHSFEFEAPPFKVPALSDVMKLDVLYGVAKLDPKLACNVKYDATGVSVKFVKEYKGSGAKPAETIGPMPGTKRLTCPNCLSCALYQVTAKFTGYACAVCEMLLPYEDINANPNFARLLAAADIVRRRGWQPGELRAVCGNCYRFSTLGPPLGKCHVCTQHVGQQNVRERVAEVLSEYFHHPDLCGPFAVIPEGPAPKVGSTVTIKKPKKFEQIEVTSFGDTHKSYVQGLPSSGVGDGFHQIIVGDDDMIGHPDDELAAAIEPAIPIEPSKPPSRKRRIILSD